MEPLVLIGALAWVILLAIVVATVAPRMWRASKVHLHKWNLHRENRKIAKGGYTHVWAWMQPDGQRDLLWSERKHKFMWMKHRSECVH